MPCPNDDMKHHRRSIRLPSYDYSGEGAYYVTICTQDRACLFGRVANGEMALNERGRIVQQCWDDLKGHYTGIELDAFIIMPNHVHAILTITGDVICRGEVASPQGIVDGRQRGEVTPPQWDTGDEPGEGIPPLRDGDGDKRGGVTPPLRDAGDERGGGIPPQRDGDGAKRGGVTPPLRDIGDERESRKHTLGQILAYYKYQTTKIINQTNNSPGRRIWQRNYLPREIN